MEYAIKYKMIVLINSTNYLSPLHHIHVLPQIQHYAKMYMIICFKNLSSPLMTAFN